MNKERDEFYQSKFEYYKLYAKWVVIFAVLSSIGYFISDCQIFGHFAYETFIPRFSIIIPAIIFLIVLKKFKSYKILVPVIYLMLHSIMWCTIWSIYYLPIKQHANEGFIIMHLMFLAIAFCAPFHMSTIFHSLLIVNIIISNLFNHYESFTLMMGLGIPCLLGVCASNYIMQKAYADQYKTKNELIDLITKDPLTNAYNRKKLDEICYKNTNKLQIADNIEAHVLILDIDFFKKINDTCGHAVGDKVLKHVVEIMQSCVRKKDYIIRWGGEEFVAVLVETNYTGAEIVAERIRKKIEESNEFELKITASIGICKYNGKDYQATISCADNALYKAKQTGRNKIITYDNETTTCHEN